MAETAAPKTRGSKKTTASKARALLFQNVTVFGPKCKAALAEALNKDSELMGVAMVETHKTAEEIAEQDQFLRKLGGKPFWAQAALTGKGGSTGGALAVFREGVPTSRLDQQELELTAGVFLPHDPKDFVVTTIAFGGVRFVVAALYLCPGCGFTGVNRTKLVKLAALLKKYHLPWLIAADWNEEPAALLNSGWPEMLGGELLLPSAASLTCTSGEGRMLDYALVSHDGREFVESVTLDSSMGLKPHFGIRVKFVEAPAQILMRTLVPFSMPALAPLKKDKGKKEKPEEQKQGEPEHEPDPQQQEEPGVNVQQAAPPMPAELLGAPGGTVIENPGADAERLSWEQAVSAHEVRKVARGKCLLPSHTFNCSFAAALQRGKADEVAELYEKWIGPLEIFHAGAEGATALMKSRPRHEGPKLRLSPAGKLIGAKNRLEYLVQNGEEKWWSKMVQMLRAHKAAAGLIASKKAAPNQEHKAKMQMRDLAAQIACQKAPRWDKLGHIDLRKLDAWDAFCRSFQAETPVTSANVDAAVAWEKRAQARARNLSTGNFRKWLKESDMDHHARQVFSWIGKGLKATVPVQEVLGQNKVLLTSPLLAMERRLAFWSKWWGAGKGDLQDFALEMATLKNEADQEKWEDTTVEQIDAACDLFKEHTAKGGDMITPTFLKRQPPEAKCQLKKLFDKMAATSSIPWQLLFVIVALLGKPGDSGGERPIALVCLTLRLFFAVHKPRGQTWSAQARGEWDQAIAGSSALASAMLAAAGLESATLNGLHFAFAGLDIEKFYDSIKIPGLIRAARKRKYSPKLLLFNLLVCAAPRALKAGQAFSRTTAPSASILAGLPESNNLARLAIYDAMEAYGNRFAKTVPAKTYVDDVSTFVKGRNEHSVAIAAGKALGNIIGGLQGAGFKISPKSAFLTNSELIGNTLRRAAAAKGVQIQRVASLKFLGADLAHKRCAKTWGKRAKQAKTKAERIKKVYNKKLRKKLWKASVKPQLAYARSTTGSPPTLLKKIRANQAAALETAKGTCNTTLLQLHGENGAIDLQFQQLLDWARLWRTNPDQRHQFSQDWEKIRASKQVTPASRRWKSGKTHGPITATICTLLDANWEPLRPDYWVDPQGEAWELQDFCASTVALKKVFYDEAWKAQFRAAEAHHLGKGLAEGFWHEQPVAKLAKLRNEDQHKTAGLLTKIYCGSLWPACRLKEAGADIDDRCVLCGAAAGDNEAHRVWQCPVVRASADPSIKGTNHLAGEALANLHSDEAFWCRGLVPRAWLSQFRPPPGQHPVVGTGCFENCVFPVDLQGQKIYLDESGGKFSANTLLRRCGWGLAVCRQDGSVLGGFWAPLAGEEQTHYKAALVALRFLLEHSVGDIVVLPDSLALVKAFAKSSAEYLAKHENQQHAEIWLDIQEAREKRIGTVSIAKVKAHLSLEEFLAGNFGTEQDWRGNKEADELADIAANKAEVGSNLVNQYASLVSRANGVQDRLLAAHGLALDKIGAEAAQRQSNPRARGKKRRKTPEEAATSVGHCLEQSSDGKRFLCALCGQGCTTARLRAWAKEGKCKRISPVSSGVGGKLAADSKPPLIGTERLHPSHAFVAFRGCWFCTGCGAYTVFARKSGPAKAGPKLLKQTCLRQKGFQATTSGRNVLKRLLRGKTPRCNMEWPLLAGVGEMPPSFELPSCAAGPPQSSAAQNPTSTFPAMFVLTSENPSAIGAGSAPPDGEIRNSFQGHSS